MNTKHTSGTWEICTKTETQIFIASTEKSARTEQGKGSYICQIKQEREHYGINEQDEANAKLISAAPDMLEAIKMYLEIERENHGMMPVLLRPITKAMQSAMQKAIN